MVLTADDLKVIKKLDDGSLYAQPAVVSALFDYPNMQGYRYNLGSPGTGRIYEGHEYKLAIIPQELRLTQAVCHIADVDDE